MLQLSEGCKRSLYDQTRLSDAIGYVCKASFLYFLLRPDSAKLFEHFAYLCSISMARPTSSENKVVVGVDFGTTFSGVAWAKIGDVSADVVHVTYCGHLLTLTRSRIIQMLYSSGLVTALQVVRKFLLRSYMTKALRV